MDAPTNYLYYRFDDCVHHELAALALSFLILQIAIVKIVDLVAVIVKVLLPLLD